MNWKVVKTLVEKLRKKVNVSNDRKGRRGGWSKVVIFVPFSAMLENFGRKKMANCNIGWFWVLWLVCVCVYIYWWHVLEMKIIDNGIIYAYECTNYLRQKRVEYLYRRTSQYSFLFFYFFLFFMDDLVYWDKLSSSFRENLFRDNRSI